MASTVLCNSSIKINPSQLLLLITEKQVYIIEDLEYKKKKVKIAKPIWYDSQNFFFFFGKKILLLFKNEYELRAMSQNGF